MKRASILVLAVLFAGPGLCRGQVSGNAAYSEIGGRRQAEQREQAQRVLAEHELPPTGSSMFVEASVLMNVKADEYVAVFGISRDGETVAESRQKMEDTIAAFSAELMRLGVGDDDVHVDFIAQNRIYGFEMTDDIAREQLVGFETKKNISIRYSDPAMLDRFLVAAAALEIFDLIKVDYIVMDIPAVQDRLMEQAAGVLKRKIARYETLLGTQLRPPGQVYAERPAIHYPTRMYDSYTAYESEAMGSAALRQRYTVQTARKSRTFYFNALDGDGFDEVINPVVVEPVVQFTLYLKIRYEIEPGDGG